MPRSSSSDRAARRQRLLELLGRHEASTQEEIVRRMAREGFAVTQATVSRDLEELGAIRVREGHRFVYVLPEHNGPPAGLGLRVLPELVIDAVASGNLVVIRTYPGMAPTVGAVIDSAGVRGVIGTVAGDDTVLAVAAEGVSGRTVAKRLCALAKVRGFGGAARQASEASADLRSPMEKRGAS
jgi:transcriptional regulator of arginine metabolism